MVSKVRIEAFSDAIIAIIITIMALQLPLPRSNNFEEMKHFILSVFIFLDSFIVIGIFWHKHCKIFQTSETITNKTSWRNLFFLFFISLFPLFTKWVIEDFDNVLAAIAYVVLFVLANLSSHFIFFSLLEDEDKKKWNSKKEWKIFFVIRYTIFLFMVLGSVILSYFMPIISNSILIGFPLLISISNIWAEKEIIPMQED